jgi:hypothetical protein
MLMASFAVSFLGVETVQAKIEAKLASGGASALCVSKVTHKGKLLEEGKAISNYGVTDADMFVFVLTRR